MKLLFPIVLLLSILGSSCKTQLEYTKRYSSAKFKSGNINKVEVRAFTLPVETKPTETKRIFDLAGAGQSALIEKLPIDSSNPSGIFQLLNTPIGNRNFIPRVIDRTKFKCRVVFTVKNNSFFPEVDRIKSLNIRLTIPESEKNDPEFISWDKIVTEYNDIDLGKLTFTQNRDIGFSPSVTLAGTVKGSLGSSANASNSQTEETFLRQRSVKVTGILDKKEANIYQVGIPGVDLQGNTIVEFLIGVKNASQYYLYSFTNLFKANGTPQDSKYAIVQSTILNRPAIDDDISATLNYEYILRDVVGGEMTYTEADDTVVFVKDDISIAKTIVLKEASTFNHIGFNIRSSKSKEILHLKTPISETSTLIYIENFQEAKNLLNWLKITKNTSINGYQFFLGSETPLKIEDIDSLDLFLL